MSKKKSSIIILRNFVFGVEDSLVSTVGLLSGIAAAGAEKNTIFLTGSILILVEALSMAVGSFLSEESTEEYDKERVSTRKTMLGSATMFSSYVVSGLIPLLPYLFYTKEEAFILSILFSLVALFFLGLISAHLGKKQYLRKAIEMVFLGGITIIAGIVVGNFIQNL